MPVNPDDLLIFKLREKAKSPAAAAEAAQQGAPAPAAPVQSAIPEAKEAPPTEERPPGHAEQGSPYGYAPESQGTAPFPAKAGAAAEGKGANANVVSYLAGALFLAIAVIFGYLIYTPSLFLISDVLKIGLLQFLNSISYEYGIATINLALVLLSAAAGALIVARPERAHRFSGIVIALLILAVTFEYLNSNSENLLVVVVAAFFEMGILAYASMTSTSRAAESNELRTEDIAWPGIEAF